MTTPPGATIWRSSRQYNKTIYRDDYQVKTAGLAKGTRRKHSSTVSDGDDVVITRESQRTNISNDKDEEVSPTKGQQGTFQTARQILMSTTMNNNKNRNGKETPARATMLLDDESLDLTSTALSSSFPWKIWNQQAATMSVTETNVSDVNEAVRCQVYALLQEQASCLLKDSIYCVHKKDQRREDQKSYKIASVVWHGKRSNRER